MFGKSVAVATSFVVNDWQCQRGTECHNITIDKHVASGRAAQKDDNWSSNQRREHTDRRSVRN
jgi:hypothetical protein